MMTNEEVVAIVSYCEEKKISYKQCLAGHSCRIPLSRPDLEVPNKKKLNKRRNRIKLLHYETGRIVIYAKMLDRGTFEMPIPSLNDAVTCSVRWSDLLKMVEGIMSDSDSRQARLEGLKDLWES